MHVRNKLNVKQIPGLTAPGVYSDGGGLYLRVRPTGSRSWLYIYMLNGKRRELGLGSVLDIPLGKAREKAGMARAEVIEGRDPVRERARKAVPVARATRFGEYGDQYLDDIVSGFRNEKHRNQWRTTIKTHAATIRETPIDQVTTDNVLAILKPIWLATPETASRVRGRIEKVLDAAKAVGLRDGDNPARWKGHLALLLPRRKRGEAKHHLALPFSEIAKFMRELRKRPASSARALEFTILTAARTKETLGTTWREIDFAKRVWTIPAERMKAGRIHQVPLSDAALSILTAIRPDKVDPSQHVFLKASSSPLSDMAMAMLLRRMEYLDITVHGFRSTFRDWAGEKSAFDREVIEMALAHTIESKAERAYRRGRALEKRHDLMAAWASFAG